MFFIVKRFVCVFLIGVCVRLGMWEMTAVWTMTTVRNTSARTMQNVWMRSTVTPVLAPEATGQSQFFFILHKSFIQTTCAFIHSVAVEMSSSPVCSSKPCQNN